MKVLVSHVFCPVCGTENEATRTFCRSCGSELHPAPLETQTTPDRSDDHPNLRWSVAGAGILVVGLVLFIVFSGTTAPNGTVATTADTEATSDPVTTTVSVTTTTPNTTLPGPVAVPRESITASASSTLPDAGDLTYGVDNTLDRDLATAWNDNTGSEADATGVTLEYRFASPVHLAGIELVNGYAKDEAVFVRNESIATALFSTNTGESTLAELEDATSVQTVPFEAEDVTTVTITILEVHPGQAWEGLPPYTDTALTEIVFLAYP